MPIVDSDHHMIGRAASVLLISIEAIVWDSFLYWLAVVVAVRLW